jgi:hypothetical protein
MWGEAFAGAPAMGMAAAAAWLGGAPVGPVVQGRVKAETKVVVVTAVGYYGNVSAIVLRRP